MRRRGITSSKENVTAPEGAVDTPNSLHGAPNSASGPLAEGKHRRRECLLDPQREILKINPKNTDVL